MRLVASAVTSVAMMILVGCESESQLAKITEGNVSAEEIENFIRMTTGDFIFVEGGEFLMGDFGVEYGAEKLPYDVDKDSKPLHKVKLSSYSIAKVKITNRDYQFYLKVNGVSLRQDAAGNEKFRQITSPPNNPAPLDWFEAEKYCSWLGRVSQLPFALPTEAQWEFAARSRGRFLMVATDDGTYKVNDDEVVVGRLGGPRGVNISTSSDREAFAKEMKWKTGGLTPLPVDRFPPNPLGLYAMTDNGLEWVKDWYDPDYYKNSPVQDPQGPSQPVYIESDNNYAKVLRGVSRADPLWGGGVSVQRSYRSPDGYIRGVLSDKSVLSISDKTARCVVNSELPLN